MSRPLDVILDLVNEINVLKVDGGPALLVHDLPLDAVSQVEYVEIYTVSQPLLSMFPLLLCSHLSRFLTCSSSFDLIASLVSSIPFPDS